MKPSVLRFEQAVLGSNHELSYNELLAILEQLDTDMGAIHNIEMDIPPQLLGLEQDIGILFCTRMAEAITRFFQNPQVEIVWAGAVRLFTYQRWMATIFASSPYVNADHILRGYNVKPDVTDPNEVHIESSMKMMLKFSLLYFLESNIVVNVENIWNFSPDLGVALSLSLLSYRFFGSVSAFSKRHVLLQWLPERLLQANTDNMILISTLHDVYMHCSYDVADNKHDIKRSLNKVIREQLLKQQWHERTCLHDIAYLSGKPVMLVLLEHFNIAHSIYRTHSTSIQAAKRNFYLIGVGNQTVDVKARQIFDEFYELEGNTSLEHLHFLKSLCEQKKVAVLYMPSVGMYLTNIFASNVRLAPIQVMGLGHPATTYSEFVDYVVVEDDYVGDEKCFSEMLLRLPKDALPYVPSGLTPENIQYRLCEKPEVVHIGVASAIMKINPYFLEALKQIKDRVKVKIHFHFTMGMSIGINHPYIARVIKSYLGDSVTAYPQLPYVDYLNVLGRCDMMLNPFPFGNTNGVIDMVTLGLVGVCKTGPEVHEHIDEALFERLGLPKWLVTHTVEEYIDCAVRLAEHHEERLALRRNIIDNYKLDSLFTGNPNPLGDVLLEKLNAYLAKHKN